MEIASFVSGDFSNHSFFVALVVTALCCIFALVAVQLKSTKSPESNGGGSSASCDCACSCNGRRGDSDLVVTAAATEEPYLNRGGSDRSVGEMLDRGPVVTVGVERQTGASMMEQLVPEITTHALSYLDYPSLCRLSMTNSLMRRAANDDNAWKALYHKDFTMEQDHITPPNGWKAYYAATRAIVNVNSEFFAIIRERSIQEMGRLWLNADYVKCVHASGELFTGYNAVMGSWQVAFDWEQSVEFQVREVRARVLTDMAWVTMKTYVDVDSGPFNVSNVFEFHNGRWFMVHNHTSVMLNDGDGENPIVQA